MKRERPRLHLIGEMNNTFEASHKLFDPPKASTVNVFLFIPSKGGLGTVNIFLFA